MATFQTRIEDYIGSVGDTAAESDWLTEGARIIADRLQPDRLMLYATDKDDTDGSTGISLAGGRPLSAHKSNYPATRITVNEKAMAADSDSNHYASTKDPVWYVDAQKGYVLPSGGTIKWFVYPTVAYSGSTISNYPSEAYGALVLYAAIQGQVRIISDLIKTTMAGVSFSLSGTLPTIASATFSYTKPTFGGSYTNIETALTNIDLERAQAEGLELQLQLDEHAKDIQNELNEYNKDVQQSQANLGEYDATTKSYIAEVNKEVGRIQAVITQYSQMFAGYFQLLKELREEYNRALETL